MRRFALIVEDNPALQKTMTEQLENMDFDTSGVFHYDEAVERLAERVPHFVCVDLELPTRSGYDLCVHIRGPMGLTRVPILVTSNSDFPHDLANAEESGASAFLKKPFSIRHFRSCVEALLGRMIRRREPWAQSLEL